MCNKCDFRESLVLQVRCAGGPRARSVFPNGDPGRNIRERNDEHKK